MNLALAQITSIGLRDSHPSDAHTVAFAYCSLPASQVAGALSLKVPDAARILIVFDDADVSVQTVHKKQGLSRKLQKA